ncbi:MAG: threonylcarbamoyl-AMP synthase [Cryomorphaceae bacterium]|nr:MAG: threonylcarbamoyl-AMP synthase [Cryomorphaceae bacterium]
MLINIHPDNPDPKRIDQVVDVLRKGGVIIYPTDTVYTIGCDLMNIKALEKVARIKNIKLDKANFSVICYDLSQISEYTKPLDNTVFKLMKKALPGAYTFILNASGQVPKIFQSKKKTVGIRVPDNNIPREIVRVLGNPIISTSVHDDDEILEYTTDPELIHEKYSNQVDLVINGGFGNLHASTIFDCTSGSVELVREGIGSLDVLG